MPKTPKRRRVTARKSQDCVQPDHKSPSGKLGLVVDLLKRPEGATVRASAAATGWQIHSVRGAMSGALKKKHGFAIFSEKTGAGRIYRLAQEPQ